MEHLGGFVDFATIGRTQVFSRVSVEHAVEPLACVGFVDEMGAATRSTDQGKVEACITKARADDFVFDLIEGIPSLVDLVFPAFPEIPFSGCDGEAFLGGTRFGNAIEDSPQGHGVIGIDPKRESCASAFDEFDVAMGQTAKVDVELVSFGSKAVVVDPAIADVPLEQAGVNAMAEASLAPFLSYAGFGCLDFFGRHCWH